MIKNDRQYRITKARATEFEQALRLARESTVPSERLLFHRLQEQAIESQLRDLKTELDEYEQLKAGGITTHEIASLTQLPETLIKGRIARGWTQKQLADQLGLKEQQIQRYEAEQYITASLDRITQVASALGLELDKATIRSAAGSSLERLLDKIQHLGLDRQFIEDRLIPRTLKANLDRYEDKRSVPEVLVAQTASGISRLFGLKVEVLTGDAPITVGELQVAGVRFKLPKTTTESAVSAYALYAHYLGLLVLQCTPTRKDITIPADPIELRSEITRAQGNFSFEAILRYLWKSGIAVLPLQDKGMFHAAYWRINGRHVIVLKQRTASPARWIIDVLHEVKHALSSPNERDRSIIDSEATAPDEDQLDEEEAATEFAGACALEGKAEALVHAAHRRSRQNLRNLKSAVSEIAREANVDLGLFANYVAYRLSLQGINWWGTATNLQPSNGAPWQTARRVLFENIDVNKLNEFDREILTQAVKDE